VENFRAKYVLESITKMASNGFKLAQDMFKLLVSSKGFDRVMDKVGQYELWLKCWDEGSDIRFVICSTVG
jgi:hypothetical protein